MKVRYVMVLVASAALVVAGCGSDSDDKSKSDSKVDKVTAAKVAALSKAKKAFDKDSKDANLCRDVAMKYIAVASPESTGDPKKPPKMPEDRDKNLKSAVVTLEKCVDLDAKDRDTQQMLASAYMATNKYDKAAPVLEQLAKSAKGAEAPNAYYAWGLAASNAQNYDDAITAWNKFIVIAPAKDPRVAQVKQSIKALQAAQKAPKTTSTSSSDDK